MNRIQYILCTIASALVLVAPGAAQASSAQAKATAQIVNPAVVQQIEQGSVRLQGAAGQVFAVETSAGAPAGAMNLDDSGAREIRLATTGSVTVVY